jgi:hypothetical protein
VVAQAAVSIPTRDPSLVAHWVCPREEESPVIVLRITVFSAHGYVLASLDEDQSLADRGVVGIHACDPQRSDREERRGKVGVNLLRRRQDSVALGRRLD